MSALILGTITIGEGHEYTQHYECAAWFRKFKVLPGTYEIAYVRNDTGLSQAWIRARGVCINANFTPRLGAHYGKDTDGPREIGKEDSINIPFGTYHAEGEPLSRYGEVTLAAGIKETVHPVAASEYRDAYNLMILKEAA